MPDAFPTLVDLIYREARLLDEWQLDEWLTLFCEDGIYWIPIDEQADPRLTTSLLYDDGLSREMRVHQMLRETRPDQGTRSQTVRMVSNIECTPLGPDRAAARSNVLIVESRSGDWRQAGLGQLHLYAGKCDFQFLKNGDQWKIQEKKLTLVNRCHPMRPAFFLL